MLSKSAQQIETSHCFVVNGFVDKCDCNFNYEFEINQLGDQKVYIGSYPLGLDDIAMMKQFGINSIINLQTERQMQERKVDWKMLQKMYKNNDIQAVFHYPIDEVS
jgi:hypothetical protein